MADERRGNEAKAADFWLDVISGHTRSREASVKVSHILPAKGPESPWLFGRDKRPGNSCRFYEYDRLIGRTKE